MFDRWTERARSVVVLAQEEARGLNHNYIGTEHLLLGLLREDGGIAARVLTQLGVTVSDLRTQVVRTVGFGETVASGQIPFTPRSNKVIELALRESLGLGHRWIDTEHLLLGLVRENNGVAARILLDEGISAEQVRTSVIRALSDPSALPPAPASVELELQVIDARLTAARSPEAVARTIAAAEDPEAARAAIAQLLGVEEWAADAILREPLLHLNRQRVRELEAKRRELRASPHGPEADEAQG